MMQWQRLTPRSFADALAVLSARRWWPGFSGGGMSKPAAASGPPALTRQPEHRPSRLVRLRRPF